MARLHAFDGVAILVHVENAELDRQRIERVDALLPRLVEGLRLQGVANATEALSAAHVMNAIHDRAPTVGRRRSSSPWGRSRPASLPTSPLYAAAGLAAPC